MDDLIRRFRDYQIEWLTSHNDIEFCEEEEKLIIGFLKDTAESFMRENQSARKHGKWKKNYFDHVAMGERPWILYCSECNVCIAYPTNFCPHCGADMRGEQDE